MINLDDRYHSYLEGKKRLTIDGHKEKVLAYGWTDNGKEITGYYVTTEQHVLKYDLNEKFISISDS